MANCSQAGCEAPVNSQGLCKRHYYRAWKDGELPKSYRSMTLAEKWEMHGRSAGNGCWEWRGPRSARGYGSLNTADGRLYAHRVAYELHNGPIPDGLVVRHKCDNPPCVNPNHLEIGTQLDNIQDSVERGRNRNLRMGSLCTSGRHLIESLDDLYVSPSSGRKRCRHCQAEWRARRAQKKMG